eukprot:scaffold6976_cov118-Isochrysis_galbana.AAC.2
MTYAFRRTDRIPSAESLISGLGERVSGQWAPSPAQWVQSAKMSSHWEVPKWILTVPSPPPSHRPNPGDPRRPSQNLAPRAPPPVSGV